MLRLFKATHLRFLCLLTWALVISIQQASATCIETAVCLNSQFEEEVLLLLAESQDPDLELNRFALAAQAEIFTREMAIHLELCPSVLTQQEGKRKMSKLCGARTTYSVDLEQLD